MFRMYLFGVSFCLVFLEGDVEFGLLSRYIHLTSRAGHVRETGGELSVC